VTLVDTNLLIYATFEEAPEHPRARSWLEEKLRDEAGPGPKHERIASELAVTPGLRSEDVPDVELAALAIEHGLTLASHDAGFRRFEGVRTIDPLA
jgi:hypothetical protein